MSSCLSRPAQSRPGDSHAPAVAALLLATSAWGSLFFVGKSILRDLDPL